MAGRTVYGGGGIMPDIFVARDTSYYSNWLNRLYGLNLIREFSLNFANENKNKFENTEIGEFKKDFEVNEKMLKKLLSEAEERGLAFNEKEFKQSEKFLKFQIKGLIAKSLWGDVALYKILETDDEILREAQKHFDKAERLSKGQRLGSE